MTKHQRRLVAAYLLDRADQYEASSPCWVALADAATNVLCGEVERAWQCGEIDKDLLARIATKERVIRAVDPSLGVGT